MFLPSTFSGLHVFLLHRALISLSSHSCLLCPRRSRVKIFARTLHQFNRSPQALQRRSFTPTPPSSPSINASKTNSPLGASSRKVSADFDNLRMAFSLGPSNPAGGSAPAELGPELSDVYTDVRPVRESFHIAFDKLQLTPVLGGRIQRRLRRCQYPPTSYPLAQ